MADHQVHVPHDDRGALGPWLLLFLQPPSLSRHPRLMDDLVHAVRPRASVFWCLWTELASAPPALPHSYSSSPLSSDISSVCQEASPVWCPVRATCPLLGMPLPPHVSQHVVSPGHTQPLSPSLSPLHSVLCLSPPLSLVPCSLHPLSLCRLAASPLSSWGSGALRVALIPALSHLHAAVPTSQLPRSCSIFRTLGLPSTPPEKGTGPSWIRDGPWAKWARG